MKRIPLTKGLFALVDDADFELVSQFKWFADGQPGYFYAKTRTPGKKAKTRLHRFLMDPPEDMVVDHIDGNTLNNCRSNLRICTTAENMRNRKKHKGNKSGYSGVSLLNDRRLPYRARIRMGGATFEIGYFADPVEAAKAYDAKAREVFGAFARLNFPEVAA